MKIQSEVFTKYAEVADLMLSQDVFGLECKLLYTEKIQTISQPVPNIKQKKVMNLQDIAPDAGFSRGSVEFKTVETSETIVLRVYWTQKEFKRFSSIEFPDGSIMTIGKYDDMNKINKATALLINSNRTGHSDWRFTKSTEPILHGLNSNYFMCFWKRS